MKLPNFQWWRYLPTIGLVAVRALASLLAGQGVGRAADIPPIGTILTNSARQADGSLVTKRYRVTTGLLRRESHVNAQDSERRLFTASVNAFGSGTHISDLPSKVLVVAQAGVLRVFGTPDQNRDGWPQELTHIYSQVSSLTEFLAFGPKSFPPSEARSFQVVPAPISHPGVSISKQADEFYSVSIDYLSGVVADTVGNTWGSYIICSGTDLVVAGAIPGGFGFGGQVLGSSQGASPSAHGVTYDENIGFVETLHNYLQKPMYNVYWGAKFIGVEELTDWVQSVTLTGRMVATGFEVSFAPVVPVASQLESSATLLGTWSPVQDVPAGATSAIVATAKMPNAPAFFRLSAKP